MTHFNYVNLSSRQAVREIEIEKKAVLQRNSKEVYFSVYLDEMDSEIPKMPIMRITVRQRNASADGHEEDSPVYMSEEIIEFQSSISGHEEKAGVVLSDDLVLTLSSKIDITQYPADHLSVHLGFDAAAGRSAQVQANNQGNPQQANYTLLSRFVMENGRGMESAQKLIDIFKKNEKLLLANFLAESTVKGDLKVTEDVSQCERVRLENEKPVNRTVISKEASKKDPDPTPLVLQEQRGLTPMDMSQEGFMKAVEKDAADLERAQRRKEAEMRATEWKNKGNVEFKAGNYEKAIEHYTEGLTHLKDFGVLYTNRAQAYNRIGRFDEALADCDLILRLEPQNDKAHIHRGKALLGQLKYDEAEESYREILKYDQKKQKIVDKYILDAKQARAAAKAEETATERR